MEPVLSLDRIGFMYNRIQTLKNISFDVKPGEIIGVLGPNGSGKSTLLKIMDGILSPQEGDIMVRGMPLNTLDRKGLAREVAMVPQETYFQFTFSALQVVLMGRFPHLNRLQFEGEKDMAIAVNALKATKALDLAQRPIQELSGGEKQRVLIARALAQEPNVILLDEPTSFLDLKYKRQVFRLISSLAEEKGLSVVLVTHDIDLAAQYCHRLIMLKQGMIYDMDKPDKVITASNVEAVYDCPVIVDENPASGRPRVSVV